MTDEHPRSERNGIVAKIGLSLTIAALVAGVFEARLRTIEQRIEIEVRALRDGIEDLDDWRDGVREEAAAIRERVAVIEGRMPK